MSANARAENLAAPAARLIWTTSMPNAVASPPTPATLIIWILFCVYCNCVGWLLSAMHQLNARSYAVAFAIGIAGLLICRKRLPAAGLNAAKLRWRFRHILPLLFLILGGLAMLGGVLHAPNNYDGLAYRTPRVLHWLAAGRWHWIHTEFNRLNTRGCGWEWVTAPVIALTGTDRWLFLINAVSYALLPGRVFSLLIRLGAKRRVAWQWMWLLPTGYGYLLQAGSIGNDLFGAVIAMAAIEFALRAGESRRMGDLWLAGIAAGLMTASKAFNLVLLLPWGLAILPALRSVLRQPVPTALVIFISVLTSLVPTAVLNQIHSGDWTGAKAEGVVKSASTSGAVRFFGNSVLLVIDNLEPPVFPVASRWNGLMDHTIPPAIGARLSANFEPAGSRFHLDEMQMEESAGLGFGVSVLLILLVLAEWLRRRRSGLRARCQLSRQSALVCAGMWVALAVWMTQTGLSTAARFLDPFYVVLAAPVLACFGSRELLRHKWWKAACVVVFVLAAVLVVISPARPLCPAKTVLAAQGAPKSARPLLRRAWTVYSVYARRYDAFAPMVAKLPKDADPLGFYGKDYPETSLWRPFGSRRVMHIRVSDSVEAIRERGIKCLLLSVEDLTQAGTSIDEWIKDYNADVLLQMPLDLRAGRAGGDWALVRLR